jgi:arylsulfatase A-like enzyme
MDLFQIPYPKDQVQGKSLLPLLTGGSQELHDYVFARTGGLYPCYVVRSKDWSLLLYKGGKLRALYDLWDDPRQRYNVIARRPEVAAAAVQAFEAFAKEQRWPPLDFVDPEYKPPAGRDRPKQAVSEETRRQLKALGYLK